jgi:hypothetical protein
MAGNSEYGSLRVVVVVHKVVHTLLTSPHLECNVWGVGVEVHQPIDHLGSECLHTPSHSMMCLQQVCIAMAKTVSGAGANKQC